MSRHLTLILRKCMSTTNCSKKIPKETSATFEWNSRLRASPPHHALSLYAQMLGSTAHPNKFTFTFLIKAFSSKNYTPQSPTYLHLHCHLIKFGFGSDPFLLTALMGPYADAGLIEIVRQLFEKIPNKDIVSWTALLSAYAKCGMPDEARSVFDKMPQRNAVSWAAVISAYSQIGRHREALTVFHDMQLAGVDPTEATLVSVLSSSAHLGALSVGKWVHDYISECCIFLTATLGTVLLTMYAKCGCLEGAIQVFQNMPQRDSRLWTAMISALAMHGQGKRALCLFDEMISQGLKPDHVTIVGVLNACSHAGLIKEGRYHFKRMNEVYRIEPRVEHYGCMIDVLGRGGHVEEAWNLVQRMPMEPDTTILKCLLSACSNYRYVDFAEWAAKKLMELDPGHGSSYVLLANVYASVGRWVDVERVRKVMRNRGVPKTPGCSLIEVDGVVHQFVVGDNEHPQIEEIKFILHELGKLLRIGGLVNMLGVECVI